MSQILFVSGLRRVLTGWDRPMQMHFLLVETGKDTVYSNLDDLSLPFPGRMTLEQVVGKLRELDIAIPKGFKIKMSDHRVRNLGNEIFDYGNSYPAEGGEV